jgi:hypothetical protein
MTIGMRQKNIGIWLGKLGVKYYQKIPVSVWKIKLMIVLYIFINSLMQKNSKQTKAS